MINSLFIINNVGYVLTSCSQVMILFTSAVMFENFHCKANLFVIFPQGHFPRKTLEKCY